MKYRNAEEEIRAELQDEFPDLSDKDPADLLPVVLTRAECLQLVEFYPWPDKKRDHLIIRVLYSTGMRIAELAALKFCDIDCQQRTVFIRQGKGEKDRYVCIEQNTANKLKEFQGESSISESVFKITDRQLRRIVEKAGTGTGISEKYEAMGRVFSPHSLRHAFSSHSFENGLQAFTLKKLLGHDFYATTEIYVRTTINNDRFQYDKFNPFIPAPFPEMQKEILFAPQK